MSYREDWVQGTFFREKQIILVYHPLSSPEAVYTKQLWAYSRILQKQIAEYWQKECNWDCLNEY
jgi:hypothetical protein